MDIGRRMEMGLGHILRSKCDLYIDTHFNTKFEFDKRKLTLCVSTIWGGTEGGDPQTATLDYYAKLLSLDRLVEFSYSLIGK